MIVMIMMFVYVVLTALSESLTSKLQYQIFYYFDRWEKMAHAGGICWKMKRQEDHEFEAILHTFNL